MSALPIPISPPTTSTPDAANPGADTADFLTHADPHPIHRTHSAHPDALREHAVAFYCEGLRSPAIAAQLGVSERTIRAWLAEARHAFAQHDAAAAVSVHERLAIAVERQLAIAAAAWQSYRHAVLLDQLTLDHHRVVAKQAPNRRTPTGEVPPPPLPPRPSTASARFLSVALAAQREAARLQGCYDRPTHPTPTTLSASRLQTSLPAKTATATSSTPAAPPSPMVAETATAPDRQQDRAATPPPKPSLSSMSSLSSESSVTSVVHPHHLHIPAKTATTSMSLPLLAPTPPPLPPLPPCEIPAASAIHAPPPPHAWQRIL